MFIRDSLVVFRLAIDAIRPVACEVPRNRCLSVGSAVLRLWERPRVCFIRLETLALLIITDLRFVVMENRRLVTGRLIAMCTMLMMRLIGRLVDRVIREAIRLMVLRKCMVLMQHLIWP